MTKNPPASAWSTLNPRLQVGVDATSLRSMMTCWRQYQLRIIEGWRGSKLDLEFGDYYDRALTAGDRTRAEGGSVADAQAASLRVALDVSGTRDETGDWVPWGGQYVPVWQCSGTERPEHLGKRKCPFAFKRNWQLGYAPALCGNCGSPTVEEEHYVPLDKVKHRMNLLRAVAWYWEEFGASDPVRVVVAEDPPRALTQLSFQLPTGVFTAAGEEFYLCGHLDGLAEDDIERWTRERKTTKSALGGFYFDGFSPDPQIDMYDLAGSILFPDVDLAGVMLEACSLIQDGARFARHPLRRTEPLREEFWKDLSEYWLPEVDRLAARRNPDGTPVDYPMSRSSCRMCEFRGICTMEPRTRERFLAANFTRDRWDPMVPRGSARGPSQRDNSHDE